MGRRGASTGFGKEPGERSAGRGTSQAPRGSREYTRRELAARGDENWKTERGKHTARAEREGRAEIKKATGKDVKIASQQPGDKIEHHHHSGVRESKQVGLNPRIAGERERLTAVHSSRSDKVYAASGDRPNFTPSKKERITHHTQASRIDRAERASTARAMGAKGDTPKLPKSDLGRKAQIDSSGVGKWRWPATGDQVARGQEKWTWREPVGYRDVDAHGRAIEKGPTSQRPEAPKGAGKPEAPKGAGKPEAPKGAGKPEAPRAAISKVAGKGLEAAGKAARGAEGVLGVLGRAGRALGVIGNIAASAGDVIHIIAIEKPELLPDGAKVPLYRPELMNPIFSVRTGYVVEKTGGKVIYRGPDGKEVTRDEALRSTKPGYGGSA